MVRPLRVRLFDVRHGALVVLMVQELAEVVFGVLECALYGVVDGQRAARSVHGQPSPVWPMAWITRWRAPSVGLSSSRSMAS